MSHSLWNLTTPMAPLWSWFAKKRKKRTGQSLWFVNMRDGQFGPGGRASPAEFSSNSNQTHLNKRHVFRIESYRWVFISVGAKLCMKGPLGPSRAWMTKGTGPKESFIWGARLACFGCSLCFYITNVTKKAIRTDDVFAVAVLNCALKRSVRYGIRIGGRMHPKTRQENHIIAYDNYSVPVVLKYKRFSNPNHKNINSQLELNL